MDSQVTGVVALKPINKKVNSALIKEHDENERFQYLLFCQNLSWALLKEYDIFIIPEKRFGDAFNREFILSFAKTYPNKLVIILTNTKRVTKKDLPDNIVLINQKHIKELINVIRNYSF